MAPSLLALLSQSTPTLETRKGLIITGLQNDFLQDGKLPANIPPGYFERLEQFVSSFREFGDVIWVRSEFDTDRDLKDGDDCRATVMIAPVAEVDWNETDEQDEEGDSPVPSKRPRVSFEEADRTSTTNGELPSDVRPKDDVDEELFFTQTPTKGACCLPASFGAELCPQIQGMIDPNKDLVITSTQYSAFGSTSLLMALRMKLITELFICGGPTNLSVYATAMDTARYALSITLIGDLLVARRADRHDMAIKHLREAIEADILTADRIIDNFKNPQRLAHHDEYEDIYEIDYGDLSNGVSQQAGFGGTELEVDVDGDEDEYMRDRPTSRRESSSLYNHLRGLRFASRQTRSDTSGRPLRFSVSAPSESSQFRNTASKDQPTNADMITAWSDVHSLNGGRKNLEEQQITETSLKNLDESSRREKIEYWLTLSERDKATRLAACSSHRGLQALASQSRSDTVPVKTSEAHNPQAEDARKSSGQPLFGVEKVVESAGSWIMYGLLPGDMAETVFDKLKGELDWQRMHHQTGEVPRLVCCQGSIGDDGSMPVYRHPSDQTLPTQTWTPTVDQVRRAAEQAVGHTLNHTLIQWYRGGADYISEHSDKTLDIVKGSYIVNVSFGAQRTMRLRTKRAGFATIEPTPPARTTYRIPMPHNSMIKMSLATNAEYLHGINADKRPAVELTEAEKAFDGHRISLTFRNIGTFLNHDSSRIWGQGASSKTSNNASRVINADALESEKLLKAFGAENQASSVRWDDIYGDGSDVLHLK